jgi:hypothetical protein
MSVGDASTSAAIKVVLLVPDGISDSARQFRMRCDYWEGPTSAAGKAVTHDQALEDEPLGEVLTAR